MLEAPFPWFGGKRKVAPWVWTAFGDVDNYVEPFAGSLAVLLHRPPRHDRPCETINDADHFLSNFWRALAADPEAVAHYADWPVNEMDLFARHLWLVNSGRERIARMEVDPDFYDAKVAGWWVWGQCAWIASGWCSGDGPWESFEGDVRKRPHLGNAGRGVKRQLPHLGDAGQGVNRKLPHLGNAGRGVFEYFGQLAARLRRVRVCCGDWTRVVTDGALNFGDTVGVLLDPPYQGDVRTADLYRVDDHSISTAVREWALVHGDDPRYRIVLCGYEPEHAAFMPSSWRVIAYSGRGAYGTAANGANPRRHLERLWLSPHCLSEPMQMSLLEIAVD